MSLYIYGFSRIRYSDLDRRGIPSLNISFCAFTMGLSIPIWLLILRATMLYLLRIELSALPSRELVRALKIYLVKDLLMFSTLCGIITVGYTNISISDIDFSVWLFLLELSYGICVMIFLFRSSKQMKRLVRNFLLKYKAYKVSSRGTYDFHC